VEEKNALLFLVEVVEAVSQVLVQTQAQVLVQAQLLRPLLQ
jgi:hypothetical protein